MPVHARRVRRRSVVLVVVFALLWLLPFGALAAAFGLAGDLPRMARFFTQAALLSFGGAYAVLPYVIEGAVREYGWLTAPLTAITTAVVGVIVNLALFFAWHVFWPHAAEGGSLSGPFDVAAVAIAIVASLALLSQRAGVVAVILASGAAGLALWLAGYSAV